MKWKETHLNLGTIKENTTTKMRYQSLEPLNIVAIKRGCTQCTTYKAYNKETGILEVSFTAGYIPKQLRVKPGYQMIKKYVTLTYSDGSMENLIFTAKIIKK